MNKFTVAVDVDCVLNNLIDKTIELYNLKYGESLTIDTFNHYDASKCLPNDKAQKFVDLFLEKALWDSLTPLRNAQWGIKQFVERGYEVYLATSTHHINFPWKVEWLKHYFEMIPESNIICIHNKGLLKVDVLVDDCLDQLLASHWYERVCFDCPWNRDIWDESYSIHRAHNWLEICDVVNEIFDKGCVETV